MKPLSAPRCVVALCSVLVAAATGASAATAATEPAPASTTEPGWIDRLAAAPGKLGFWKKEPPSAAAPEVRPVGDGSAAPRTTKAAAPPAPKPASPASAPAATSAPAEMTDKPGFFARLPSLPNPFAKKPVPAPAEAASKSDKPVQAPAGPPPQKAKPETKPPAKLLTEPAAAAEPPKEPGFLGRLWPGRDKPAAADHHAATTGKKLGPTKPGASKKLAATETKPTPTPKPTLDPPAKPSLWSRLASAVVSGKAAGSAATPTASTPFRLGSPQAVAVDPAGSIWVITKDESPFYTFGPHQATPPDEYLSTGTVVTLQEKTWGWAQVQLSDGRTGTIARTAVRPATAADLVPASSPPSLVAATARRGSSGESYVMPPAAMPDLPTGATSPTSAAEAEELSSALLPPFAE